MSALLLAALIAVESAGNPHAVGDGGHAVGVLQIHPAVVQDVNRIASAGFTLADRRNPAKAQEIARIYLSHYVTPQRLGRAPTAEDYARCWNGGPDGWRKRATVPYWAKVRAQMRRLSR